MCVCVGGGGGALPQRHFVIDVKYKDYTKFQVFWGGRGIEA